MPKTIARYRSKLFGGVTVVAMKDGELRMVMNTYTQGIWTDNPSIKKSYWYVLSREVVSFCSGRPSSRVLVLGLGANTIPRIIANENKAIHQTLVDIDPMIIEICRKHFALDTLENVEVKEGDVLQMVHDEKVNREFHKRFDVIVFDIFTGSPPFLLPDTGKASFLDALLPWLQDDGAFVINRPASNPTELLEIVAVREFLTKVFENVEEIRVDDVRGFMNSVIISKKIRQIAS